MIAVNKLTANDIILKNTSIVNLIQIIKDQENNMSYLMTRINELSKNINLLTLPPQIYTPPPYFIGTWTNTKDNTIYFDINSEGIFNKVGGLYPGSYNPQYNYTEYNSIFYKRNNVISPSFENPDVLLEFFSQNIHNEISLTLTYRYWTPLCICISSETYTKN